jgi:hypothetical protein
VQVTWTYSGDPASSLRDQVRFLIGDTDTDDQLISDEEIAYLLTQSSDDVYQAAYEACYTIGSKFARLATSKSVGDLSLSFSDRSQSFFQVAARMLELGSRRVPPTPWVDPNSLKRAGQYPGGMNGTEYWTGQMDYYQA